MEIIKNIIENLPQKPGVYQFISNTGEILYIGKAKNIKKRIIGHYGKSSISNKQEVLLKKAVDIRFIVVENESDALLLENNLIKEYKPRYNILLKDDKTYPWICIKNEPFPRVFITRRIEEDGSEYFGPYTSVVVIRSLFSLIKQLYKLRTCNFSLTLENIGNHKFKKCLEYHIGNCKAPCEGLQNESDYLKSVEQIRDILKGNIHQVITYFNNRMMECSASFNFEEAHIIKQKLDLLEKFRAKSVVVNPKINNIDVFSIVDDQKNSYVNYLRISKGAIVQALNIEVVKRIDEEKEDVLLTAIIDVREKLKSQCREIIVPFMPGMAINNTRYIVPVKGDKKKLLELSERNVTLFRLEKLKSTNIIRKLPFEGKALESLKKELNLEKLPVHIECIDNSNIQGTNPVASCVVFREGRPAKSDYRHYNIKDVKGINDFASMEEIVARRFKYYLENNLELPDLLIVDGGKGQLNAAYKILNNLNIQNSIKLIGIAKRLEEIFVQGDQFPLYLDKNSPGLKLIQRIRNEAHRFGIGFHRNKRSGTMLESELDSIPGIGNVTKEKILTIIRDPGRLKVMSLQELTDLAGNRAGNILYKYYKGIL